MSYEFFIAKRYLRSKRKSKYLSVITLISISGVLIGVAALTFILSMMNGFEKEVRSRIIGITAHVTILSSEGSGIKNHEELFPLINTHPQVKGIAPFIYLKAAIASKEESDGIVIRGIIPEKESEVTDIEENLIAGKFDLKKTEGEYPGIVLGATLADRLRVKLGDEVILFSIVFVENLSK